jgi:hypothetical protein
MDSWGLGWVSPGAIRKRSRIYCWALVCCPHPFPPPGGVQTGRLQQPAEPLDRSALSRRPAGPWVRIPPAQRIGALLGPHCSEPSCGEGGSLHCCGSTVEWPCGPKQGASQQNPQINQLLIVGSCSWEAQLNIWQCSDHSLVTVWSCTCE